MKLYFENNNYKLYNGNMLELNNVIADNSIDAVVTDPPYELGFMGKSWDSSGIAFQKETWRKCFNALKPGGYLLAFGGSRTFHRIACAIEDAGFEIRDTIMWLYGSGFPKSMNISLMLDKKEGLQGQRGIGGFNVGGIQEQQNRKAKLYIGSTTDGSKQKAYTDFKGDLAKKWQGWGTALKPSFEPIIVARKPCEGSCTDNVLKWGVGGINIDECRIPFENTPNPATNPAYRLTAGYKTTANSNVGNGAVKFGTSTNETNLLGRFPTNTILTYDETDYDEVCGGMPIGGKNGSISKPYKMNNQVYGEYGYCNTWEAYNDEGSASRYFYCAKASKRDRDEGLDGFEDRERFQQGNYSQSPTCSVCGKTFNGTNDHSLCGEHTMIYVSKDENRVRKNTHPTVKPTALMQYLVRLVAPKGATILDPFMGSGSTGKATMYENMDRDANYKFVGIELTDEYLPIAKARIDYVVNHGIVLDRGEDETVNEQPTEPVEQYEKFGWDF